MTAFPHMVEGEAVYWTVAEAAEVLHKSVDTIRRQLRDGTLPGGKFGTWFVRGDLVAQRSQGTKAS